MKKILKDAETRYCSGGNMSKEKSSLMKFVFIFAAIILAGVLIFTGMFLATNNVPGVNSAIGSGRVITSNFNYSGFSEVQVWGGYAVNITYSDSYSIKITTDDNIMGAVYANITGDLLKIGFKPGYSIINPTALKVEITMPAITGVDLSGGIRGNLNGFIYQNQSKFNVVLSGGSTLIGLIKTKGASNFILSGGSTLQLEGLAKDMVLDVSGGSTIYLLNYKAHNADLIISGGSTVNVNLDGRLNAVLSGGSRVYYTGNPVMGDISLSGGSTMNPI
jgi:hypothetical protein